MVVVVVLESHREGETMNFRRQAHQGQLNWYPSLVQRIGMSERPSRTLRTASQTKTAKVPGYLSTWVHGDMAGMGSTAKAVDAGVAGFNWNSPLVAHLARPGARITEAWLGKDGRTLACLESSNAPPFLLAAFQGCRSLAWPGTHPGIQPSTHTSSERGNIYVPSQLLSEARFSDLQQVGGLLLTSSSGPSRAGPGLRLFSPDADRQSMMHAATNPP